VRRRAWLLALPFASACSFDLDAVARPDGAPPDAPQHDGPPSDGGEDALCAVLPLSASAQADTMLASTSPGMSFGAISIANVGTALGSFGLFRFDVSMLPPTARVQSVRIDLTFAATATSCGPACGSCMSLEHGGTLSLYYLRSDWVENEATWNQPAIGLTWGTAGAEQAGVDRSAEPIATITHTPGASERITVDSAALAALNITWRQNGLLSFKLRTLDTALMIVATRESGMDGCVPGGYQPAKLVISYCP